MTVDVAFRPSGMLAAYAALDVSEDSDPTTEDDDEAPTIVHKIAQHAWLWYNRVDGWNVGLQAETGLSAGTTVTTKLGYAFDRKKIAGVFGLSHPFTVGLSTLSLFGSVADETRPVFDSDLYGLFLPGMMAYGGYRDYYDYYRRRQIRFGASWENSSGFFKASLAAQLEQHDSQEKNSNYDGWFREIHQRPNPEIQDGRLGALALDIELGNDRVGLDVSVEHAPSGMPGNDFDFTTIRGAGRVKFNTFFNDRDRPNQLLLIVTGGASSGSVPLQRSGAVQGAIGFVSYSGSLRSLSSQALTGDNYAGVFLEHDFTTGLFESLHLWRLADSGMGLVVFGGAGRVFDGSPIQTDLPWYLEAGFGLSHFFRLPVRVDVAWRIDEPGWAVRIGKINL
ncbi:MAG: hypothetical protein E2O84_05450 [Bacteroidetes bacterium]|nr:MAG: hypothetical protein E2O84_05450 [Bacteroidota bacterium]